jgi:hypothetical protein
VVRLLGVASTPLAEEAKSFAELHERIDTATSYLDAVDPKRSKRGSIVRSHDGVRHPPPRGTDTPRELARRGAKVIAVPSADWPEIATKHYVHGVFRALETGAAVAKAEYS